MKLQLLQHAVTVDLRIPVIQTQYQAQMNSVLLHGIEETSSKLFGAKRISKRMYDQTGRDRLFNLPEFLTANGIDLRLSLSCQVEPANSLPREGPLRPFSQYRHAGSNFHSPLVVFATPSTTVSSLIA